MFFDETAKIEAHESEVLCVEFSPNESGKKAKLFKDTQPQLVPLQSLDNI